MTKIDIHADDYGYSLHTSQDILDCMKEGRLDSISIICNTRYFSDSMDLLKEAIPSLPFLPLMSIHLDLPEGHCDSELLPMGWGKLFLSSFGFNRNKVKEEIRKELKRQIDVCQPEIEECIAIAKKNKIPCTQEGMHLDSHVHTHLIPVVWDALTEVIEEEKYEVGYIRNPKEPLMPFLKSVSLWKTYSPVNLIKNRILMFLSGKCDRYCDAHKIGKMYLWGLTMSGHMDHGRIEEVFAAMCAKAQKDDRVLEILFHPGLALTDEYVEEMSKDNFRNFNSDGARKIEKEAVMKYHRR